jgi:uncharacterized protein YceK
MKLSVFVCLLMAGILISGCASHKKKTSASVPKTSASVPKVSTSIRKASSVIITPDASLAAKVVRYNSTGRFVVLNFPVGQMPGMGRSFFLYHNGLKAGEIKITGPQGDSNIVADLVTGDAQVGDEVRDQ